MTRTQLMASAAVPRTKAAGDADPAALLNGTKLLDTAELEQATGLSRRFWQRKRTEGGGPKFIKLGDQVRYEPADVRAYLASLKFTSTAAVSVAIAGKAGAR